MERSDPARNVVLIVAALLLALVLLPGAVMGLVAAGMGLGAVPLFGGGMPVGMAGIGVLMSLLWIVLIVGGVFLMISALGRGARGGGREDEFSVLRRRYAAGDISREEYERIRADLTRDRAS
jgi:putative membrane protein